MNLAGFITKLTTCSKYNFTDKKTEFFGDGAVDIIAEYYQMEIYIQCKNLANKVGPNIVREINGVTLLNKKIGCIVSKNGFTDTAIKEAQQYNIILTDEDNISKDLIDYYNNIFIKEKETEKNIVKIKYNIENIQSFTFNNIQMDNLKNCTIEFFNF